MATTQNLEEHIQQRLNGTKRQPTRQRTATASEKAQIRAHKAEARKILTGIKAAIDTALDDENATSVGVCQVGDARAPEELTGVGRYVYDGLVASGLEKRLFIDIDMSGNAFINNEIRIRLRKSRR